MAIAKLLLPIAFSPSINDFDNIPCTLSLISSANLPKPTIVRTTTKANIDWFLSKDLKKLILRTKRLIINAGIALNIKLKKFIMDLHKLLPNPAAIPNGIATKNLPNTIKNPNSKVSLVP